MITKYYACYAVLRMLRNSTQFYSCYANITQTLRIDYAIFTQWLRKYNADITQCLRIYNAMFTHELRRVYAVIMHCYAGITHVTQIFACYADLCMLRKLYAGITRALRSHYADITQSLGILPFSDMSIPPRRGCCWTYASMPDPPGVTRGSSQDTFWYNAFAQ